MIVFTIVGLLVFWAWCFEIGYYLVPAVHVLEAYVRVRLVERHMRQLVDVYAGWVAAQEKGGAA